VTREARTLCWAAGFAVLALAAVPVRTLGDAPASAVLCKAGDDDSKSVPRALEQIQGQLDELAHKLAAVSRQAKANGDAVAAVEGKLDGPTAQGAPEVTSILQELKTSVSALEADVKGLEAKLDSTRSEDLAKLAEAVAANGEAIAGIEGKLDDGVAAALKQLLEQTGSNGAAIADANAGVSSLLQKSGDVEQMLSDILAGVTANGNAISGVQSSLSGISSDAVLSALDKIEAKLDDETRFADDAELANVLTFVTANSTKIGWLNDQLQPKLASISNKLGLPKTNISSQLDAIETKLDTP
jgi:DNA repair exonuclease SbcCD ATPase subunit